MVDLVKKIDQLPDAPGVYLFFNTKKELIYVGKATSLRSRVRSYWRGSHSFRPIEVMIHEVVQIKYKKTDSVLEAIILEGDYIKKFRPKYNIDWRDDKSWNYITISHDPYPQVATLREHEYKKMESNTKQFLHVFGPYPGLNTKAMLNILRKIFDYSTCRPGQAKPCFYRQMGQCLGVCTGEVNAADYRRKVIMPLVMFLSGRKQSLLKQLHTKMVQASKLQNFEEASRLRDQIKSLQRIQDVALVNKNFMALPTANVDRIRIEGYDISNLGVQDKVGSLVVFSGNQPVKSDYKKFNIKTVIGQSDVDCLSEVLNRRLKHAEWPLPDIFLVDGGMPQVNMARRILREHKIDSPLVGIAKGPTRRKNNFIVHSKNTELKKWVDHHQNILISVRDEAHRFAIAFNRSKRKLLRRV